MQKIHQLPQHLISKIAAGEVIERPAYAVKELLENAIDAGSDTIKLELEESGLRKIVVTDNGEGMTREDVLECFKPHTTSKISDDHDLVGIKSLGFRGEALASIVAISNMTIASRTKNDHAGMQVRVHGGIVEDISPIGIPIGTRITVENLFYTVPARKKFLKTVRTELRHITELIMQLALAYPHIKISYIHNGKPIFDFPKHTNATSRMQFLLGYHIFQNLVPLSLSDSYITITGFVSKPHIASTSQQKQYLFVNKRKVSDKRIASTVKQAYGTLLDSSYFPIFVLFISLPHEAVDVNIHPRKDQVAFVDTQAVLSGVHAAIQQAFTDRNLIMQPQELITKPKDTKSYAGTYLKDTVIPWSATEPTKLYKSKEVIQIHTLYILIQTKRGVLVVDQHAAHERILYEQFLQTFSDQKKAQQIYTLPKAVSVELSVGETELIAEYKDQIQQLGFELEEFWTHTIKICAIPQLLKDRNPKELLQEILDDLSLEHTPTAVDVRSHKMLAYLACRSAIKAGQSLSQKSCKNLLEQLDKTPNKFTCPHGRPTHIEIPLQNLHKLFKRM